MPTRITRSYSRKGLLGGRVRYTQSHTLGGPNVQLHLTGRDLLEMQRRAAEAEAARQARAEQLRAEHEKQRATYLAGLHGIAAWLHVRRVAITVLVAYLVLTVVAFVPSAAASSDVSPVSVVGTLAGTVVIGATVALAFIDWWGVRTLGRRVNWPRLKVLHPRAFWWAVVGCVFFFFVPGALYLWDCVKTAPTFAEIQRAQTQEQIARLERELLPR